MGSPSFLCPERLLCCNGREVAARSILLSINPQATAVHVADHQIIHREASTGTLPPIGRNHLTAGRGLQRYAAGPALRFAFPSRSEP